ncbi:MAG: thioredoxin domain-containing protein [Lentisphaeraceae bacterium]|nr:thioredoxin domain-containing protein [Lentisphaeraceae bacterium]
MRLFILLVSVLLLSSCQEQKPSKKAVSTKPKGPSAEEIRQKKIKEKMIQINADIKEQKSIYVNMKVSVVTLAGTRYEDVDIMDWSPLKVHLYSSNGMEIIGIRDVSEEEGEKLGFDKKLASDYSKMKAYLKRQQVSNAGPEFTASTAAPSYDNEFVKGLQKYLVMSNESKGDGGAASKKFTLLYFSASWCPPCHKFTPSLVSSASILSGMNCGIVMVSADKTDAAMYKYMKSKNMPWAALPYSARVPAGTASYGQSYIPSLTLVDAKGEVVLKGGGNSGTLDKVAAHLQANK